MLKIIRTTLRILLVALTLSILFGCAHSLEANYGEGGAIGYALIHECPASQLVLAVKPPHVKDQFEQALSESIIDALGHAGCFSRIIQNYSLSKSSGSQSPDLILETTIGTTYTEDTAKNWATQWPGVIVFTTWWKGLLYFLDINTEARITDSRTGRMINVSSKDKYNIHYSSTARGVFSGSVVGWFVLTGVAFLSALVPTNWDENMKTEANLKIRDEYGKIIAQKIIQALKQQGVDAGKKKLYLG